MKLGNRHSQHSFARVPQANIPRSVFNRSFAAKDTMDFDLLTPVFLEEVLPGDTMNLNLKTFIRLSTQEVPVLDNMMIDFYAFFVPNRLVWDNFVKQMGEQDNPTDSIDYITPSLSTASSPTFPVGSLADHFGLPTGVPLAPGDDINALPFRSYNLIYNTWFRDQNLQNSLPVLKTDGPDPISNYTLQKAAKKHDYFTSALPFLQKGDPVTIPVSGTAPVIGDGSPFSLKSTGGAGNYSMFTGAGTNPNVQITTGGSVLAGDLSYTQNPGQSSLMADFNTAAGSDAIIAINAFRQAIQLQSFLERDARGGTRYTEILTSHFRVSAQDFRLQRPEFLSGATININQHPVAQTSESSAESPQANLAAFSTATEMGNRIGFSKSFVEHGFVMILARARADVTYQQGLSRMWTRKTKFDYFWPEFQELGEQAILNEEIYYGINPATNKSVFGYQERHAEYRYRPSEIRGQFRSTYAESLDVWHLAEEFESLPLLNSAFIQGNTPIERVLTVAEGYPALLCDYWFDLKHVRPMVAYPVPASLGRF